MRRFLKSLQSRLTLLIILVALPSLIALIYLSVSEREHAMNSALDQAIKTVETTTRSQSLLIEKTEVFLKHLSTFNAVLSSDSTVCSAFLAELLKVKEIYSNIGVPSVNGELLCNAKPLSKAINVFDRPYIQQAISTRRFSIGEFQVDRATGVTSINFAYPVIQPNSDEMVGVAVAVLSLDWWNKQLAESHLPENTVAYISDHQQKIIATYPTNNKLLGTPIADVLSELREYKSNLNQTIKTYVSSDKHKRVFVNSSLFSDSKLITISVGIPFEEKLFAINSRLIKAGIIVLLFVILMFLIATWGIKKSLITPLKALIQSTKDLELGQDVGNIPLQGFSELVDLQKHFTLMAKTRLNAEKQLANSQLSLQDSENQLSSHIENTPLGCISWDTNFICIKWNKSAENIFGYQAQDAIGRHASELIVRPELNDEITSLFQLLLNKKVGINTTNENQTKTGKPIICEWYNTLILAKDGSVIGVTSLVQDVTKSKQLKEQLTRAASVFSHAREGIIITDTNGNIIEVNESFANITGYTRAEVIGKNPSILKSNRQPPEFYQQLWKTINDSGYWCGEVWNKRKNHDIYAQLLTISAVHDDSGEIKNYVAIFTDISEIKEQQQRLEHMVHYDVLTNLPNRTLLADRLNHALVQSKHHKKQVAIILLDLDGFKEVNDTHGHSVGDELLIIFAARFKDILRDCDTLSRYGGDEFVAVLDELEHSNDYLPIVERMLKAASAPIKLDNKVLNISASIGVTIYPFDHTNADQLIRHADQAMYVAKQKGKNCYHLFDIESEDAIKNRHATLQYITTALENREFVLFYQPKVNMKTGDIIGAEALIRWQHPSRGLVAPGEFLPFIENQSLSIDIGEWVIEEALNQLRKWQKCGLTLPISVNIGALQIQQPSFAKRLEKILNAYPDVAPSALQLEILETSELADIRGVAEIMNTCVKLGVSFAIDDFGTGYSSLTYLRRLPAILVKIDQTFIRDMLLDPEDKAIVIGVIGLAKSFNRKVIAEGVETIAHGTVLLELGCELAQGYGIAKPMPADEIPKWIDSWKPDAKWQIDDKT